jgi:hypothetical protein
MSRLINEPIITHQSRPNVVTAFIWRRRLYRVLAIIGWWREPAKWWDNELIKFYIRVNARNTSTGTYELYKRGEEWFLHRVLD